MQKIVYQKLNFVYTNFGELKMNHIIIAIDGPAGAGKTTIAEMLAKKLGIFYFDTGSLYRAMGLKCKQMNLNPANEIDAFKVVQQTNLSVVFKDFIQHIILNNTDVTNELSNEEIGSYASRISAHKVVRQFLVKLQQDFAKNNSVVMDGRDIGTVVLKKANYKFYLTANVEVRAKRRFEQLKKQGKDVNFEDILAGIKERDNLDMSRKNSPLKASKDAIIVDCSNKNENDVISEFLSYIKEK